MCCCIPWTNIHIEVCLQLFDGLGWLSIIILNHKKKNEGNIFPNQIHAYVCRSLPVHVYSLLQPRELYYTCSIYCTWDEGSILNYHHNNGIKLPFYAKFACELCRLRKRGTFVTCTSLYAITSYACSPFMQVYRSESTTQCPSSTSSFTTGIKTTTVTVSPIGLSLIISHKY